MLKSNADQKDATWNPPTISEHNNIINELMTSKNNPSVRIVTGSVNKTIIGLMKMLSSPNTTATMSEVAKPSTRTPGRNLAITITNTPVTNILRSKFIVAIQKFVG